MLDFGQIWRPMPKVVFSKTLERVDWNSRIVRGDVTEELPRLRREFEGDMDIGGATLAASFIRAGLIDEYRLFVHPVVPGEGTPFFPRLEQPLDLRLAETKQIDSGVVYLRFVNA